MTEIDDLKKELADVQADAAQARTELEESQKPPRRARRMDAGKGSPPVEPPPSVTAFLQAEYHRKKYGLDIDPEEFDRERGLR